MKRRNGEGTWGKKNIKGKEYMFFRNSSGKYFYGKTQKEIKEKIKKYEESNLINKSSDVLFNENLLVGYKKYSIIDIKIGKITSKNITQYYNTLATDYSLATIKKVHTLINQCFSYAIEEELIETNPALRAKLPSEDIVAKPKKEIPFLSYEDMEKLYNENNRVQTAGFKTNGEEGDLVYGNNAKIIILIMYTGLRISEALGLKWCDVNLAKKYISVNRNLSRVKNREEKSNKEKYIYVETTLKKSSSKRTIPLCDRAMEVLMYLKEHNKSTEDLDYVCMSKTGNIANMRNITKTLNAMLIRANCEVKHCGMHSLRHSFGSYLVSQGVDISVVSKLMGHKNISVTYNVYIHILNQSQIDAINMFNKEQNNIPPKS